MSENKTPLSVLMEERKKTQQEVATALGVSRQAVQRWQSGLPIKVANLKRLAQFFNVSVSYLTGEADDAPPPGSFVRDTTGNEIAGYTRVPIYSVSVGCNPDYCPQEAEFITGHINVADWFLRTLPGVTGLGSLSIVPSTGDSMEPTIASRSLIVIDGNQRRINQDGIYCIRTVDQVIIKRVQRNIDGTFTLISDNAHYQPVTVRPEDMDRTEILGRVIYCFNGNLL